MNDTILKLKERIQILPPMDCQCNLTTAPPPPVSVEQLDNFERETGLRFPEFIRRVYTEVAHGGFGPAWGLNRLNDDNQLSIAEWDRIVQNAKIDDADYPWPENLIRIAEIGCNMYYGVDIFCDPSPVYAVDPTCASKNIDDWLTIESECVIHWLDSWADKPPPTWIEVE